MKESFAKLRPMVKGGVLSASTFLDGRTVDEVLELRDQPEFDEEWMRVHGLVKAKVGDDQSILASEEDEVFQAVYSAYESSDLSACVSEDLGLLARALAAAVEDPWLSALCRAYVEGRFPTGSLKMEETPLGSLVAEGARAKD